MSSAFGRLHRHGLRLIATTLIRLRWLFIQGAVWRFMERDDSHLQAAFEREARRHGIYPLLDDWEQRVVPQAKRIVERRGILAIAEERGWI